jgi:predicted secreted acid phosphatase
MTRSRTLPRIAVAAVLLGLLAGACAQRDGTVATVPVGTTEPMPNLGLLKQNLLRYHASGAYARDLAAVAGEAARYLEQVDTAGERAAIVLDIDETSLSNWPYLVANDIGRIMHGPCDLPEGPCGWVPWAEMADAAPIDPTLALARFAQARGMALFLITGRPESQRSATVRNLRAAGYPEWAGLYMEPDGATFASAADFKAPKRREIVEQGYTIVLNMGDQLSDLEGGYAERTFKLPNPFYWIP